MSARSRLLDELRAGLPNRYVVDGTWATPDNIDPGNLAVRCWVDTMTPGPTMGGLTFGMVLWVLTPATTADRVDTELDAALVELLGVLHPMEWCRWTGATRAVLDDTWHGYRFELTAAATMTPDTDPGTDVPPLED